MYRPLDLFAQHLFDARMVVSERIHRDACQQVEISFVGLIRKVGSAAFVRQKLIAGISSKKILFFQFFDLR